MRLSRPVVIKFIVSGVLALMAAGVGLVPYASGQANVTGQWSTVSYTMPINPIHAALLANGNILIVAGSGNCPPSNPICPSGPPYGPANGSGALLVNPASGSITQFSLSWDMFCNGMVLLPDGRAFINGGTIQYDPFYGALGSAIFDPSTNTFTNTPNMAHGRWYPTVLTLSDGRIMTFSGLTETGATNDAVEIYSESTGWSTQYISPWTPPLYPRLHLLPNGQVFYSGSTPNSALFDPSSQTWTQNVANTNYCCTRTYGTSVLLPLSPSNSYDPKIIIMGGNSPATNTTEIIDMGATSPAWVYGPNMSEARIEMNAVILPNGKVLAVGGSVNDEDTSSLSLNADLYDPVANTFSSAGANASERLYHSVALLLPDATVWLAGGNPERGTYNNTVEIYQPAYLFNSDGSLATRPVITAAPASITYGNNFTVTTPNAANISSAVLVRNGTVTHAFGMDQREVALSFTAGSGSLTVTAPPNGNIAPPGYYMLFLLNSSGVPSLASFVLVTNQIPPAPTNLAALPGNAQVGLTWSAASEATSYNLKRATTSGGPYTTITSTATTSYTDTGVTNGTTYYYVVSAVNVAGESPNSGQVSVTPQLVVPPPPGNVVANGGSGQVGLTWNASNEATSYNVKRSTTSGGPYTTIGSPTATSYIDSTVSNGTTYYYVVSAVNTAGQSANSSEVNATPSAFVVNYSAGFTSSGLQTNGSAALNGTRLRLTDGGGGEAGSAFYTTPLNVQSFTTNFSFQMTNAQADGMAFVIQNGPATALGQPGEYLGYGTIPNSIAVKFDIFNNVGEGTDSTGLYLNGATPTLPAVDMTSSGVALLSSDVKNVQISYDGSTLTLTITDATTQQTFTTSWAVNIPATIGSTTGLVGFSGGTGGDTAIQDVLNWTYSLGASATPPAAPTNLTASSGNTQVVLSWTPSGGATSYNVQRSTTNGGPYSTIASPTTASYADNSVTNGTTYYYVVSAVNAQGASSNSSQVSATPQLAVPAAPTNLAATAGNEQVGLSWSASTGATSYNVKRSTTNGGPYTTIVSVTSASYTDTAVTNGTTYYYVVSGVNTVGEGSNSNQASVIPSNWLVNYSGGFSSSGLQLNGNASLNGTRLRLTDGGGGENSSAFYTTPVNVQSFTTNFGFQMTNAVADGITFIIQNGSATTMGTGGEGLGSEGIANSVAVKFDIYNNAGEGTDSTGMYTNGATPTIPAVDMTSSGVNLVSGDVMNVQLTYDGTTLTLTITDATTLQSFTTSWPINIPTTIGNTTAYVGFTGSSGGYTAIQDILNWTYNPGSATTPPAAPTNLLAFGGSGQVTLNWSPSNGATSYNVQRSTTNGGPYATVASPTAASYTDIGVTSGTTYFYVVAAVNSSGTSSNSNQVSATPQSSAPAAPANLAAIPGNGQVGLTWTASSGATSYNVQRSTTNGGPYSTVASPTVAGYTDNGVTNGTTYYYVVAAVNSSGTSGNSSQVTATPQGVPAAPTNPTAAAGNAQVVLTWTASSGAASYNVKRSTTNGGPYSTIASPTTPGYTDTGVTNGTAYYYVVSAVNTAGESANSSQVSATPAALPAVPANLVATAGNAQVAMSWTASSGATSYNVKRSATTGGPYTTIASPTTKSYTDKSVTNGTIYYYVVSAVNAAGESANSSEVNATPVVGTAATPKFSPTAGTYAQSKSVTITDTTSGSTIYYTTDGTTPATNSSIYGAAITVSVNSTIKAMATAPAYANSPVASAAYNIQAAAPTFNPGGRTFNQPPTVSINDAMAGATIYYTSDGTTPTSSSAVYTTPIVVNSNMTIKAMAAATGYANSSVSSSTYDVRLPTPTLSPAGGTYGSPQSVSINETVTGVTIYYTTDGTTPTTSSPVYNGSIAVNSNTTIKAMAAGTGYTNSLGASATYSFRVPTPVFSPAAGTYASAQPVSITDSLVGATIYYTTDGTNPTTSSTVYTTPITVSKNTTIKALATTTGYSNSAVASAIYKIQ